MKVHPTLGMLWLAEANCLNFVHPHPRFTEVGVFFASFGNSRSLVNREFMTRPEHHAKRQGNFRDPFLAKHFRHLVFRRNLVNQTPVNRGWGCSWTSDRRFSLCSTRKFMKFSFALYIDILPWWTKWREYATSDYHLEHWCSPSLSGSNLEAPTLKFIQVGHVSKPEAQLWSWWTSTRTSPLSHRHFHLKCCSTHMKIRDVVSIFALFTWLLK